ncbi:hypothetical protein [Bartonella massiliensis]|uniref:hypothetical protein n=1 Tax=Bartonella massiliensis TaxID=929795 RepID=UPI001FE777EC|nr:hypothetical protein [Bartonella massiliensis]
MISTFSLSQVANVHASYWQESTHRENIFVSAIEQKRKDAVHLVSLYTPNINRSVGNEITLEGNFEKVVESLRLGNFGLGMALGYASHAVGMLLGWMIFKMICYFKSC